MKAQPLTQRTFAPFGHIIEADRTSAVEINTGFTTRFDKLAEIEADSAAISIFRGRVRPLEIAMLERHPHGSQAFFPLGGRPWLAVVATAPSAKACKVFYCEGNQGLQYAKGVWHHPLLVLDQPQDFLVIDRLNPEANLEEYFFDESFKIRSK